MMENLTTITYVYMHHVPVKGGDVGVGGGRDQLTLAVALPARV